MASVIEYWQMNLNRRASFAAAVRVTAAGVALVALIASAEAGTYGVRLDVSADRVESRQSRRGFGLRPPGRICLSSVAAECGS